MKVDTLKVWDLRAIFEFFTSFHYAGESGGRRLNRRLKSVMKLMDTVPSYIKQERRGLGMILLQIAWFNDNW